MIKLQRLLLPAALVLCLAGGAAVAQTIVRALQLSQDTSGAFGVDANSGIYFPSHLHTLTNNRTPSITGTGTPTLVGSDTAGVITMGSSATTATVVFARAYGAAPFCVLSPQNAFTTTNIAYTTVTTSLALTQNSTSGNKINYICMSTT